MIICVTHVTDFKFACPQPLLRLVTSEYITTILTFCISVESFTKPSRKISIFLCEW